MSEAACAAFRLADALGQAKFRPLVPSEHRLRDTVTVMDRIGLLPPIDQRDITRKVGKVSADGLINLPEGASASLVTTQVSFDADLQAPIKKGQVIGKAAVYLADEKIREIDLTAAEDVKEGWFLSRFGITNLQTVILFFALAVILAFCILILVLRTINKRKRKAARQRRLMEAARRQMEREKDLKQRNWPY